MKQFEIPEKSACGVGFITSRQFQSNHQILKEGLKALACQEHRGGRSADRITGDGSGIMTNIPFELFGISHKDMAVAMIFAPQDKEVRRQCLQVFEDVFGFMDLEVSNYREVPINLEVLGEDAKAKMPYIVQAFIKRPKHTTTDRSFDKLLYTAKQYTRTKLSKKGLSELYFPSLSANTIVYKSLCRAEDLKNFYLDLQHPNYKTGFTLFHRRFSTNTTSTWDKAQPFRLIGHNGEFNTITGNRSWAISREKALGLFQGELLEQSDMSDSGSLNEMAEALTYRSSIPFIDEVLSILMPPADIKNSFYKFWSRAMEPWEGPALVIYADGENIGARLDRNGFRPCRWAMTEDFFYLSSEAGSFNLKQSNILGKGTLKAGAGVRVSLKSGNVYFADPSQSHYNFDTKFDARTVKLRAKKTVVKAQFLSKKYLFSYTQEDFTKILVPMITTGKEAIGSMGDTARLVVFSKEVRSFFDYFCHNFAQVTNPPLDYLREKSITDLTTYIGRKPNIFAKKELIPPSRAFEVDSPVLSLGQMAEIFANQRRRTKEDIKTKVFDTTFKLEQGFIGFKSKLETLQKEVKDAVASGISIIVLSDATANYENPAIPCLLALGAVTSHLRNSGLRLKFSIVIHSGEIRTTHQLATTIGMGASAVCPYLALEIARFEQDKKLDALEANIKEENLIKAFENGLLKIMSKMGISVVRSYQSSRLFTAIGIDKDLVQDYFWGVTVKMSGIGLKEIAEQVIAEVKQAKATEESKKLYNSYIFKEQARGKVGEKHSMTAGRSKLVHQIVRKEGLSLDNIELYSEYLKVGYEDEPITIRHLFQLRQANKKLKIEDVQATVDILKTFGSGAMSFGAISAEAQRDIFYAMQEIGGRSNSGEGGENPYYFKEGITAYSKQVASGRFGVTALYLIAGEEVQIKIAQGAKPGEGGQLMGIKVGADIAKARNSLVGVDLISPPPLHDIYSIEDLKQLIYEIKQLKPNTKVNVKLVSGANIATIACGVAKAGADVIHISGGEGGTGAATLSSMKHAGLPWEFGLIEVHEALLKNNLRHFVKLRTDGGLHSGKEIVIAAILGAEEFDFGKLLLIAQGCIMARVCEKNTCPTGIATHNPRFKAKYKGNKDHIVSMMYYIAEDVQRQLALLGEKSLRDIIGRTELLEANRTHLALIKAKKLDLGFVLSQSLPYQTQEQLENPFHESVNLLNEQIVKDCQKILEQNIEFENTYKIATVDRAIPARLCGEIAKKEHLRFSQKFMGNGRAKKQEKFEGRITLNFEGSAGQGFGAFLTECLELRLWGEANDSVCKSMSGGKVTICPSKNIHPKFIPEENIIVGNVALYGATSGVLYIRGLAGDRFAVRNSGAVAVVEGVGLHACEYMTRGKVVILGETDKNVGGGMTGGEVILFVPTYKNKTKKEDRINREYLTEGELEWEDLTSLRKLLEDYYRNTQSQKAKFILEDWEKQKVFFQRFVPVGMLEREETLQSLSK